MKIESPLPANLQDYCGSSPKKVEIRGDPKSSTQAEVDGLREISWWVLGYGDQARVIGPAQLRKMVAKRVGAMHAYYNGNGA